MGTGRLREYSFPLGPHIDADACRMVFWGEGSSSFSSRRRLRQAFKAGSEQTERVVKQNIGDRQNFRGKISASSSWKRVVTEREEQEE